MVPVPNTKIITRTFIEETVKCPNCGKELKDTWLKPIRRSK
jgi:hypothetical protein